MSRLANRRCRLLAALALWAAAGAPTFAQEAPHIAIGDRYAVGEKIVAEFVGSAVEGAEQTLAWQPSSGLEVEQVGARLFVWAPAGEHTLALSVTYKLTVLVPDPADPTKGVPRTLVLPPYQFGETFVVGNPPPPVPPTPIPPEPGPDPPTPPVEEGKRTVVIIRESADQTPAQSRLFVTLRNGAPAEYFKSKGHSLLILDDDDKDPNGQPYKLVTELLTLNETLPALYILEPNTASVLHHRPLTESANAAGILSVVREHGG